MRTRNWMVGLGASVLAVGLAGCSFSASYNSDAKTVVKGSEAVVVKAQQPAAPELPPPTPAVAEKPVEPAPVVQEPAPVAKPLGILRAKLAKKKIEITEKVMFDYNKATIKPDSNPLLGDVAQVMQDHPEVSRIRIEGHTDGDGEADYNKKLSQERADAVKAFLVGAGVDEGRMESVGRGEDKPIAENKTEEGKEKNRRVEFNIVARTKVKPGKVMADKAETKADKAKAKADKAEAKADKAEAKADKAEAKADKAEAKADKDEVKTAKPVKTLKAPKAPKVKDQAGAESATK